MALAGARIVYDDGAHLPTQLGDLDAVVLASAGAMLIARLVHQAIYMNSTVVMRSARNCGRVRSPVREPSSGW